VVSVSTSTIVSFAIAAISHYAQHARPQRQQHGSIAGLPAYGSSVLWLMLSHPYLTSCSLASAFSTSLSSQLAAAWPLSLGAVPPEEEPAAPAALPSLLHTLLAALLRRADRSGSLASSAAQSRGRPGECTSRVPAHSRGNHRAQHVSTARYAKVQACCTRLVLPDRRWLLVVPQET
jgi:hypothetical protein